MRGWARAAGLVLALGAAGVCACRTAPRTPPGALRALEASPGGYLSGAPVGLSAPVVLNREDFVYDARLSPDGALAATTRLGLHAFHLTVDALRRDGPSRVADVALHAHEFDVEALEFSPDGAAVASASRDGALRVHAARGGAPLAAALLEEPLTAVAWHPSGASLAVGGARGLVALVAFPSMRLLAEVRAHADEVRAVAFTPRGELVTAGWDARLRVFGAEAAPAGALAARAPVTRKAGVALVRAVLDGATSVAVALDARLPALVVRSAVAEALGLEARAFEGALTIPTALGSQVARVAPRRTVTVRGLTFTGVDVAVCDACVPADAQAAWGGPALERVDLAFDDAAGEVRLTARPGAMGLEASSSVALVPARDYALPAPVNDLSLDASGRVAGVAFSETKAQRTKAVYDREKRREVEPEREWDCAARVDVQTGAILERRRGHRGVVSTAAVSPDGQTLASGGWDRKLVLHGPEPVVDGRFGWSLRRVRFSRDGRFLVVAAWTPQNPLGDHRSDPSAVVYEVQYGAARVEGRGPVVAPASPGR